MKPYRSTSVTGLPACAAAIAAVAPAEPLPTTSTSVSHTSLIALLNCIMASASLLHLVQLQQSCRSPHENRVKVILRQSSGTQRPDHDAQNVPKTGLSAIASPIGAPRHIPRNGDLVAVASLYQSDDEINALLVGCVFFLAELAEAQGDSRFRHSEVIVPIQPAVHVSD